MCITKLHAKFLVKSWSQNATNDRMRKAFLKSESHFWNHWLMLPAGRRDHILIILFIKGCLINVETSSYCYYLLNVITLSLTQSDHIKRCNQNSAIRDILFYKNCDKEANKQTIQNKFSQHLIFYPIFC